MRLTVAAPFVVAVVATGAFACTPFPPEVLWRSAAVRSPDSALLAQVKEVAYDNVLFVELGREVEIRSVAAEDTGKTVLVVDGDWRGALKREDAIGLRWIDNGTLEVSVPNLTECMGSNQYQGIKVQLLYRDDDPKRRNEWIKKRQVTPNHPDCKL